MTCKHCGKAIFPCGACRDDEPDEWLGAGYLDTEKECHWCDDSHDQAHEPEVTP